MKKKIHIKTKLMILFIITLLLFTSISYAANRTLTNTQDTIYNYIRNSNGKFWDVTNNNVQLAIWDLNSTNGGVVTLPGNQTINIATTIIVESNVTLEMNGCVLHPTADINVLDCRDGSIIYGGTIDIGTISFTNACIYLDGDKLLGGNPKPPLGGVTVYNMKLRGYNDNSAPLADLTGNAIHLYAGSNGDNIAYSSFSDIKVFNFNKTILMETGGNAASCYINNNYFNNIDSFRGQYLLYQDLNTGSKQENNVINNYNFQSGTNTQEILHIEGTGGYYQGVSIDFSVAAGSIAINFTSGSGYNYAIDYLLDTTEVNNAGTDNVYNNRNSPNQPSCTLVVSAVDSKNDIIADYICDGVADEVTINAAITRIGGLGTGGKILLLEGQYNLSNAIVLDKSDIDFVGCGDGTYIVGASGKNIINITSSCENTYIHNMFLYGNNGGAVGDGIEFASTSENIFISDLRIENCKDNGIVWSQPCENITIENCRIRSCEDGLDIGYDDSFTKIINNEIESHSDCGIELYDCENVTIIGNSLRNNGDRGLFGWKASHYNRHYIVTNNQIWSNTAAGFYVTDVNKSIFSNNIICNNGDNGLVFSGYNNTINSNIISFNTNTGLFELSGSSNYNIITSNNCLDNTGNAIDINGGGTVNCTNLGTIV